VTSISVKRFPFTSHEIVCGNFQFPDSLGAKIIIISTRKFFALNRKFKKSGDGKCGSKSLRFTIWSFQLSFRLTSQQAFPLLLGKRAIFTLSRCSTSSRLLKCPVPYALHRLQFWLTTPSVIATRTIPRIRHDVNNITTLAAGFHGY